MKILAIAPELFFQQRGTPMSVYYRTKAICELGIKSTSNGSNDNNAVYLPKIDWGRNK